MYEPDPEYQKTLQDYVNHFLRHKRLMLSTFAVVFFGGLVVAYVLPPLYESKAVILIDQPEVPPDLVRSTVTSYADQRLQVIKQRVATTDNLRGILRRYDLYPDMRETQSLAEVAEKFRTDIGMETISASVLDPISGRPRTATIAFSLSFVHRDPQLALQITNELVTFFLSENIRERQGQTAETAKFLARESERLAARIGDLEGKLADFKRLHFGKLPGQTGTNLAILERSQSELMALDRRLQAIEQEQRFIRAELSTIEPTTVVSPDGQPVQSIGGRLQALRGEYSRLLAIYGSDHPDVLRAERELAVVEDIAIEGTDAALASIESQLRVASEELNLARQDYSSKHPEVMRLEGIVKQLESDLAAAQAKPKPRKPISTAISNPRYVLLQAQLSSLDSERKSLREDRRVLQAKIEEYEMRLLELPEIERAYLALVRDYENEQAKYRETKDKLLGAELSQSLELERMSERFTLIEPPQLPSSPIKPKRKVIVAGGLVLAFGLAGGLVLLLGLLDESIYGGAQLASITSERPLVAIPQISTAADRAWRVAKDLLLVSGLGASFAATLWVVHIHFRPLDNLWLTLVRQIQI